MSEDWSKYDDNKADEAGSGKNRAPIPIDTKLRVKIEAAEERGTSKGGVMIKLTLAVVAGPHKKRKVWHTLNVVCGNEAVSHSARRELQTIARRVGLDSVNTQTLRKLIGGGLIFTVTEHEEGSDGKIYERVGIPEADPDAPDVNAQEFDEDDIPF